MSWCQTYSDVAVSCGAIVLTSEQVAYLLSIFYPHQVQPIKKLSYLYPLYEKRTSSRHEIVLPQGWPS